MKKSEHNHAKTQWHFPKEEQRWPRLEALLNSHAVADTGAIAYVNNPGKRKRRFSPVPGAVMSAAISRTFRSTHTRYLALAGMYWKRVEPPPAGAGDSPQKRDLPRLSCIPPPAGAGGFHVAGIEPQARNLNRHQLRDHRNGDPSPVFAARSRAVHPISPIAFRQENVFMTPVDMLLMGYHLPCKDCLDCLAAIPPQRRFSLLSIAPQAFGGAR